MDYIPRLCNPAADRKRARRRWSRILMAALVIAIVMIPGGIRSVQVHAAGTDAGSPGTGVITLRFTIEDAPVSGAAFTCRRAGSYSDFPEVRRGTAEQVLKKIKEEEKANGGRSSRLFLSGTTDSDGRLKFEGLPEGVYVIEGDDILTGRYIYRPQTFLMSSRDPETEEEVTAQIKYERIGKDPEKPVPTDDNNIKPAKTGGKLPQTGLDWTIIRFLTGTGLLLIAAGTGMHRKAIHTRQKS